MQNKNILFHIFLSLFRHQNKSEVKKIWDHLPLIEKWRDTHHHRDKVAADSCVTEYVAMQIQN